MLTKSVAEIPVISSPYPHIAFRDAVQVHDGLVADFPAEDQFGAKLRMHGDMTTGDPGYETLTATSPAYKALHDWVYSEAFIETFLEMFDEQIEMRVRSGDLLLDPRTLPRHPEPYEFRKMIGRWSVQTENPFLFPRLDIGIGKVNYGLENGGSGIHVDNLTRLVSILLYIDDNPTMVGGEHRLYRLEKKTPVIDKVYAAQGNLMVASLQSNSALHDVNPVTEIEGFRKAMYMAVSCSTEIWRPHRDSALQKLTKNRYRPTRTDRAIAKLKRAVGIG